MANAVGTPSPLFHSKNNKDETNKEKETKMERGGQREREGGRERVQREKRTIRVLPPYSIR